MSKLEQTLPSYRRSAMAYERLAAEKLVGTLDAEARQREALEHEQDLKAQSAFVTSLEINPFTQEFAQARLS